MEKLIIQRKVEIWIEDIYDVKEINEETIDRAIDYDIDATNTEVLWDTAVYLGPIEVYNDNWELLRKDE